MQKKKLWIILGSGIALVLALAIALPILLLSSKNTKINWNEVLFESKTVIYDGNVHYLEVKGGDLPDSMEISYENNGHRDVGVYEVIAHFKDGDKLYPDMMATLTILKSGLEGISFEDKTVTYNGEEQFLYITGELPEGVTVHYENNGHRNAGAYEVSAVFTSTNENFEALGILKAWLRIEKAEIALDTISFEDQTFTYDGGVKSLHIDSFLPEGIQITYVNNEHRDVGVYEVTASFTDTTGNYIIEGTKRATLTILKASYDMSLVTFSSVEIPYDGLEHELLIQGQLPEGVAILRYVNNKRTELGSNTCSVEFIGDEKNYNPIPKMEATLTIVPGKMTFLTQTDFFTTYNGNLQSIEYPNLPEGIVVTYENNAYKNAGTYVVIAHFKDSLGRYIDETKMLTFHIEKATYDMSGISFEDTILVYDGLEHSLFITGKLPEGVKVSYSDNHLTEVGQIEIIATFQIPDSLNYYAIPAKKATLTIVPNELTSVFLEDETFTYDGNMHGLTLKGELPLGVTYEFINNYHKEVGIYEVIVEFNIASYAPLKATLTIVKADIDMSNVFFHGQTFVYDGKAHSIFIEGNLPDIVRVSYLNNTRTEIGIQTATAIFEVLDKIHYNDIPNLYAEITIINNQITGISFKDKTVVYNQQSHSIFIEGQLPEGVTVTYLNNGQRNVGEYEIVAQFHDATGKYEDLTDMVAKLTIVKASFATNGILFLDRSFVYDGNVHRLDMYCDDLPSDIVVVYENNDQINAGVYIVKVSFIDALGNYHPVASKTATLTIHRKKLSLDHIIFENEEYEYDGFEHTLTIHGELPEGVEVRYSPNSLTKLGRILVTASFIVDERNYEPIPNRYAYLTITKGVLDDITLSDKTLVYDGNLHSITIEGTLPEGVSVEYVNHEHSDAGVYEVTALFYDAEGYYNSLKAILTILKATYDMSGITFLDKTLVYDGFEHTLQIDGILPEGVSVIYSKNSLINAGRLVVTATFIGNPNYEDIPSMQAVLTIEKIVITGITFPNGSFLYDGQSHSIYVQGVQDYPIEILYYNNERVNAGTYEVIASFVIKNENYAPIPNLKAILEILPIPLGEVTLEDQTFILDGNPHYLETTSVLPEGVYAVYENNGQMYEGVYTVTMRLESHNSNYILPGPITAVLTIVSDGSYHTVIFHLGDGTTVIRIVQNNMGLKDIPTPAKRPGYEGYYEEDFTHITTKLECYPIYRKASFQIHFDYEAIEDISIQYLEDYTLPIPVKEDYIFKKWVDADGNEVKNGIYEWTDDITLYPIWQCKVILQNTNGHIYEEIYLDSNACVEPTFPFSSYLEGFYKDKDLTIAFDLASPVLVNLTLYAKYSYDFSFSLNEENEVEILEILDKTKISYNFTELIYDLYPVVSIPDYIFAGCSNLEEVALPVLHNDLGSLFGTEFYPNSVSVEQRQGIFYLPKNLHTVILNIEVVPTFAFLNCSMIERIYLHEVKEIEGYAFADCIGLEEIFFRGGTTIQEAAFRGCIGLGKVHCDSLTSWINMSFYDQYATPMQYAKEFYVQDEKIENFDLTGVKQIGLYQFYNFTQMKQVKLLDVQTIEAQAFMNCSGLESVWLGVSLVSLGMDAFAADGSLENVYYTADMGSWSKLQIYNPYATPMYFASNFYVWDQNTYVELKEIRLDDTILEVGDYQFYGFKNITSIELMGVSFIGKSSFANMNEVSKLALPASLTEIDINAFLDTRIQSVSYAGTLENWANIHFLSLNSTPLCSNEGKITFDSFPLNLEHITLTRAIEYIDAFQFYGFKDTKSVEISLPINSIGQSAFAGCSSLESFSFQSSADFIIMENAFLGCTKLKDVYYFGDMDAYTKIKYKNNVANPLYYQANLWINGEILEELLINSNPEKYQFSGIQSLKRVTFTDDVTEIGEGAFSNCTNLEEVIHLEKVTKLGNNAFEGNASLRSIALPELTIIPNSCFRNCMSLEVISIPKVTSVGSSAFLGCKSLLALSLEHVEEIKDSAFKGCSSLTEITLGSISKLEHDTFANCFGLEKVILPETLTYIAYASFYGCSKLVQIVIPESVYCIESNAFAQALNLIVFAKQESQPARWQKNWHQGVKEYYWFSEVPKEGNYWHYDANSNCVPW